MFFAIILVGAMLGFVALIFRDAFVPKQKHASYDAGVKKGFGLLFFGGIAVVVVIIAVALLMGS